MILGIVLAAIIVGASILITALLVSGKEINIHVRHTYKTIESCNWQPTVIPGIKDDTQEMQEAFNKQYAQKHQEFVNMDGVIAEVNKVMGIEVPDINEGDK